MIGAGGVLRLTPGWEIVARLQSGSLSARTPGAQDRSVGEMGAELRARTDRRLTFVVGVARRAYSTTFARQRWTILSLGADFREPFLDRSLRAVAQGALLPLVSVSGLDHPRTAYRLGTGLELQRGAATFRTLYRLERYDFPAGTLLRRQEQFAELTVQAVLSFGGR
jgi:hypothetical protein